MKEDLRHIQLRLSPALRDELETLAGKYGVSISDTVRGCLQMGMPVFEVMSDLRGELARRFVEVLKRESRHSASVK